MIPPLFPKAAYAKRRELLARHLVPNRDLIVFFNAPEKIRNYDSGFPYRPDSHFIYLTGYAEPQSAFLLWREKSKGGVVRTRFEMFVLPRDPAQEQWDGYRWGVKRAGALVGAQASHEISHLEGAVHRWLSTVPPMGVGPRLVTNAFGEPENRENFLRIVEHFQPRMRRGRHELEAIMDVRPWVQAQRVIKSAAEIEVMRTAADINVRAYLKLMRTLRPGMRECEVRALLEAEYMRAGALDVAYGTIAAAGDNATILHYRAAREVCQDDELLLVDAGCEYEFYASDITRTLPVSGKYTREQRLIMDLVMEAHSEAMLKARPGNRYSEIHKAASECLRDGLKRLKLLPKGVPHTRYYPHGTGHWLGLDVHDPCHYLDEKGASLRLVPGMAFTIEPGLYFMRNDRTVPAEFRGIGVRIEDDVVVTRGKPDVLTADLPRAADEIEREMVRLN